MTDPTKDHKRTSKEGQECGAIWAGMAEKGIALLATEGEPDARCKSCAFRLGTVPNGCAQTQLDVTKSVMEAVPFMCHAHANKAKVHTHICHGWYAIRVLLRRRGLPGKIMDMPYEFSPPDKD